MSRSLRTLVVSLAAFVATTASSQTSDTKPSAPRSLDTTAPVLWQPSMNVFRRFAAPKEKMFEFYGTVLGFRQLTTLNVNTSGGGVARFQAGAQELKLTGRVPAKHYQPGGVRDATGLRLLTFFFADEVALSARFSGAGDPAPTLPPSPGAMRRSALVVDPDAQAVEPRRVPDATPEQLAAVEAGSRWPISSIAEPSTAASSGSRARAGRRRALRDEEVLVSSRRDDDQPTELLACPAGRRRQRWHSIRRVGRRRGRGARGRAPHRHRATAERPPWLRAANDLARRPGRCDELLRRDRREPGCAHALAMKRD